jgi:formylglycine-generating enzyme required for sulfatase activity
MSDAWIQLLPTRLAIAMPITLALFATSACDRPQIRYASVDEPDPVPIERPAPPPKPEETKSEEPVDAAACGRGTGRNAAGECVSLATRQHHGVQQVQLPAGDLVIGDLPSDYDFRKARSAPQVKWAGQPPRLASVQSFWIDLHEVTRKAYAACVAAGKCTAEACDPSAALTKIAPIAQGEVPQTCVTHEQAVAYCKFAEGRLPTEVEWEYAGRGVDARIFPWGTEPRDEFTVGLFPVSLPLGDGGYFNILGQGTNATEWVADVFELDGPLKPVLTKEFRAADGPLLTAQPPKPGQHVFKSARLGDRYGASEADALRGFRCASDLGDTPSLTVPASPPRLPIIRPAGPVVLFGGVAEAVSHAEATAFCEALSIDAEGHSWTKWRLPTMAEVNAISDVFRGPGPFWSAADGPLVQVMDDNGKAADEWTSDGTLAEHANEALAARCVHEPPAPEPPR